VRRMICGFSVLLLLCPVFLVAKATHRDNESAGGQFKDAGHQMGTHMASAGADLGHGTEKFGSNTVRGKPVKGTAALGEGVGGFGKEVGVGTGKSAAHVAKGTAKGVAKIGKIF